MNVACSGGLVQLHPVRRGLCDPRKAGVGTGTTYMRLVAVIFHIMSGCRYTRLHPHLQVDVRHHLWTWVVLYPHQPGRIVAHSISPPSEHTSCLCQGECHSRLIDNCLTSASDAIQDLPCPGQNINSRIHARASHVGSVYDVAPAVPVIVVHSSCLSLYYVL